MDSNKLHHLPPVRLWEIIIILADSYYLPQASLQPYEVCITPPLQSRKLRHSNLPTVGSGSAGVQTQAARPQSPPGLVTLYVHSSEHVVTPVGNRAWPPSPGCRPRAGLQAQCAVRLPVPHATPKEGSGAGEDWDHLLHSFPLRGPTGTLRWHKRGQPHLHLPSAQHCSWVPRASTQLPCCAYSCFGPLGAPGGPAHSDSQGLPCKPARVGCSGPHSEVTAGTQRRNKAQAYGAVWGPG